MQLKKGMLGGNGWKRRWCTSDGHKLTVWSGETVHDGEAKSDYVLYNRCVLCVSILSICLYVYICP